MGPRLAVAVLAVLVVVSGCVSLPPNQPGTDSPTSPAGTTQPTTGGTTTTAATGATTRDPSLTVSPVFAFENLSASSQEDLLRILEVGHVRSDERLFDPPVTAESYDRIRVRYDGSVVVIRHLRRITEERTCLLEVAREDDPPDRDGGVQNYSSLSPAGQELFRSVLEGNATDACFDPGEYPLDQSYVQYEGTTYSLNELHGSKNVYVYTVAER